MATTEMEDLVSSAKMADHSTTERLEIYLHEIGIGSIESSVESFEIDFGIQPEVTFPNGLVYPTNVSIMTIAPSITIGTPDIDTVIDTLGIAGAAQGITDSTLTLVDVTQGGTRGSSPITFTIDEGRIGFGSAEASHGGKATSQLVITPVYDAFEEVIAITGI